jgi:ubiquinone/menaquinone biosynthesis C-methylase UbiE
MSSPDPGRVAPGLTDGTDFRRASRAVWDAMAPGWDDRHAFFEETARPVTERMLERLAPAPGAVILELAAGTGVAGFAAAAMVGPGGHVILSDFSEAMVATAERRATELGLENVECRVLDAEQLDLADETVDGVLCRWGYMLMADPAAALAETRRVLRPGGRLSCAVFAEAARNPWAALPSQVLQEGGHMPPASEGAPGILALADGGRLERFLVDAGLPDPAIEDVEFTWRFTDADDYWAYLTTAAGAIVMVLDRLDDETLQDVRREIGARVASFDRGSGIELPAACLVASADAPEAISQG